jgi:ribosomal 50S subunit-associated protein YjgA (DUF615 family)
MTPDLTLRDISPDLADILDTVSHHDVGPAEAEAIATDWLIAETMRQYPDLDRKSAEALIAEAEAEAARGGL